MLTVHGSRLLVLAIMLSTVAFITRKLQIQYVSALKSQRLQRQWLSVRGCSMGRLFPTTNAAASTDLSNNDNFSPDNTESIWAGNVYQQWTVEQDRMLFENRRKPLPELASMLGRGLGGVESRLDKLKDVDSSAYERLFAGKFKSGYSGDGETSRKEKLVPSKEVLRRIQHDVSLSMSDFAVLHYDRVEDAIVETPMDAPNKSVSGPETQLVLALPEHRVVAVKYKDRIVWDRQKRIDRVFGSTGDSRETIDEVISSYEDWKREKDMTEEWNRQRQAQVSSRVQQILGLDRFAELKGMSSELLREHSTDMDRFVEKKHIESFIQGVLRLFRDVRTDPSRSLEPSRIPMTDIEALYTFSELAALLPDADLRTSILTEISHVLNRMKGKKGPSLQKYELPELEEDDLTETFVRGSGAGGQKINKTSNRVVLVHEPTQLRVECQETRSLQQNRRIARKRLRLKLDEYLNGSESKATQQARKAVSKKAKSKARSRARNRRKKEASSVDK